jgi:hypothetical protein
LADVVTPIAEKDSLARRVNEGAAPTEQAIKGLFMERFRDRQIFDRHCIAK